MRAPGWTPPSSVRRKRVATSSIRGRLARAYSQQVTNSLLPPSCVRHRKPQPDHTRHSDLVCARNHARNSPFHLDLRCDRATAGPRPTLTLSCLAITRSRAKRQAPRGRRASQKSTGEGFHEGCSCDTCGEDHTSGVAGSFARAALVILVARITRARGGAGAVRRARGRCLEGRRAAARRAG